MHKFMLKKKSILGLTIVILALVAIASWVFISRQQPDLPTSGYFKLIDDPKNIIYNQDISELSVTPEAVTVWQEKIKELEAAVPNISDELEKKRYYNDLGMYYGYLGQYQTAYDYYVKSLDISYIDRVTWLQFGDLLIKMKAYLSAEAAYKQGNEINPYEQLNYSKLAELYMLMGKSESEVVAVYDQGIATIDKATLLFRAKAYYYEKNKNYTEAIKVYEAWIKIADEASKAELQEAINKLKTKI